MSKDEKLKVKSLLELRKSIEKDFGAGSLMFGQGSVVDVDVFPTGVAAIDLALGCGGIPQGRIIELYGTESSGKTTTCLQFIAACQQHEFDKKKRRGTAAFIDAEHSLDPQWATKVGVNMSELLISQPDSAEQVFSIAEKLIESGLVDLIIVDSVAALIPQAELDSEIGDSNIAGQARLMSKGMRKLKGIMNKTKTTVIFINQIRQKVGIFFGSNETTPGGLALKFYASVRAEIRKGSALKVKEETIGFRPSLKLVKNKVAAPFTKCEYDIHFGKEDPPIFGVDTLGSLIDVALQLKVIQQSSSFFSYNGAKHNGKRALMGAMRADNKLCEEIRAKTYAQMSIASDHSPISNENTTGTELESEDADED